jgi:opacity protein-like surface antigen
LWLSAASLAAIAASAAVAAAATAIPAASSSTATVAATSAASATGRTRFAWTSFIDSQGPAFDGLAIEFCDRFLRVCLGRHGDEGESARFTGEFVLHQRHFLHRASLRKKILKISLGRVEGKISYV